MKAKILRFSIISVLCFLSLLSNSQGTWTYKTDFGGTARERVVATSIGTKAYIGTGWDNGARKDFWEYDPLTNIWTQKADFGGNEIYSSVSFSIGSKIYIGTGWGMDNGSRKDFWEYDPSTNIWIRKADFGGTTRGSAVGFSIGTKGYIGTGLDDTGVKNDFWEYDPSTNVWTQKADFAGPPRVDAAGFSIGTKGYIGTGWEWRFNDPHNGPSYKDFWEYDPSTNIWTQKADFGGLERMDIVAFSIGTKGYFATGTDSIIKYKDFWEYDPSTNIWTKKADFGGTARNEAVGFSVGSRGYIGTGTDNARTKDFWEYSNSTGINETEVFNQIQISPNPSSTQITIEASTTPTQSQLSIINQIGQELISQQVKELKTTIDISTLPNGVYFVRLTNDKTVEMGKFVKQ